MSYKEGVIAAILALQDRTGSSTIAIKKHMQSNALKDKKWLNATFLLVLKNGTEKGEFIRHPTT